MVEIVLELMTIWPVSSSMRYWHGVPWVSGAQNVPHKASLVVYRPLDHVEQRWSQWKSLPSDQSDCDQSTSALGSKLDMTLLPTGKDGIRINKHSRSYTNVCFGIPCLISACPNSHLLSKVLKFCYCKWPKSVAVLSELSTSTPITCLSILNHSSVWDPHTRCLWTSSEEPNPYWSTPDMLPAQSTAATAIFTQKQRRVVCCLLL